MFDNYLINNYNNPSMKKYIYPFLMLIVLFIYSGNLMSQTPLGPNGLPVGEQSFPLFQQSLNNTIPSVAAAGIFFNDSFEDKTYNQWVPQSGSYLISVDSLNSPDGFFHLQMIGGDSTHQNGLMHIFSPAILDYVSFYVNYSGGPNEIGGYFVILPLGGNVVPCLFFFIIWNDGTMRIYGTSGYASHPYTGGQWYHIEFKNINWITQTLDWYVDNSLVASNFPFRSSTTLSSVGEAQLYNWNNSTAMYDQIILSGYPSGIEETGNSIKVSVSPNPADDHLFINYNTNSPAIAALFDITGTMVHSFELINRYDLDISDLPAGIYLLSISNSETTQFQKIVIK